MTHSHEYQNRLLMTAPIIAEESGCKTLAGTTTTRAWIDDKVLHGTMQPTLTLLLLT